MKNFILLGFTFMFSLFLLGCGDEMGADFFGEESPVPEFGDPNPPSFDGGTDREVTTSSNEGAQLIKTVTCSTAGDVRTYNLYKPGGLVDGSSRLCKLDRVETADPADWRAEYEADYCEKKLDEVVASNSARGYTCN